MCGELQVGCQSSDNDLFTEDDEASSYYVQLEYQPVKGFYIIPEIGKFDKKDSGYGVDQKLNCYFRRFTFFKNSRHRCRELVENISKR